MERRSFLKSTIVGAAGLALTENVWALDVNKKQLTILHTNDVHSYIDPFPADHPKNPNKGGIARRAAVINKIREENPNTLLLDAGDIFQGTPYFNFYGGALEIKLMSLLGYDFATLGNHDFDNGIEGLSKNLKYAKFKFVSANYDLRKTILDGQILPYQTIIKGGVKVGIFGLGIDLKGLIDKKYYKETNYLDPVEIATDITAKLKQNEKCDLVICLSHLGYEYKNDPAKISDLVLAGKTKDIDLIIGGHTHTFLEKPTLVKNSIGKEVLVNQTGCYGLNLGRVDFFFEKGKKAHSNGISIAI